MQLSKDMLPDGLGLTCIENDCMCIMKSMKMDYKDIFYKSYLCFSEVFQAFYRDNAKYERFHVIERVQRVAEQLGYLRLQRMSEPDIEQAFQKNKIFAACVEPEWLARRLKASLLRDDHYLLLERMDDEQFHFVNDSPRAEGTISIQELKDNYLGYVAYYEVLAGCCEKDEKIIMDEFYQSVLKHRNEEISYEIEDPKHMLFMIRDVLGVLRVIIKRTSILCHDILGDDFLERYYGFLGDVYGNLEYHRLKRQYDVGYMTKIIDQIYAADEENRNELIESLKRKLY